MNSGETVEVKVTNLVWLLRLLAALHVLVVFVQAVSAGTFLDGEVGAMRFHQMIGTSVVTAVSLLQVVVATICWRRDQQSSWYALASFGVFAAEMVQIGLGFTGELPLHVPLGVLIFGAVLVLLFASLRHFEYSKDNGGEAEPA